MKPIASMAILLVAIGAGAAAQDERSIPSGWSDILSETFGFGKDTEALIPLDELRQGCPKRDCIPSIEEPTFVAADEADYLADDDLVLAVDFKGEARAYPTKILNRHEIVNDTIQGRPVAVTYCPLCGSGVAFERKLDGEPVELGVSGLLHNSDLVMYDRRSETLWAQVTGKAIAGPKVGDKLQRVAMTMTEWATWRDSHPETKVLSRETGFGFDYSVDPYSNYASSDRIMFPVSNETSRLTPKTVVYGVEVGDGGLAVTADYLKDAGTVQGEVDGRTIEVTRGDDGSVTATDTSNGERLIPVRSFWFAWYTFHPETALRAGPTK